MGSERGVDEDVQAFGIRPNVLDQTADRIYLAYVELRGADLPPASRIIELLGAALGPRHVEIGDDNPGAVPQQAATDGAAEVARAACHHGDPIGKIEKVFVHGWRSSFLCPRRLATRVKRSGSLLY